MSRTKQTARQLRLMPATAIRRQARGEATALWSRVLLVALVGCGATAGMEVLHRQSSRQQLQALEAQHAPIDQLRHEIRLLRSQISSLNSNEQLSLELASNRSMVSLLGQIGKATAFAGGDLFVSSMAFERSASLPGEQADLGLEIEGEARDHMSVTRFTEGLRNTGLFRDVQLSSTESKKNNTLAVTAFELECVF